MCYKQVNNVRVMKIMLQWDFERYRREIHIYITLDAFDL